MRIIFRDYRQLGKDIVSNLFKMISDSHWVSLSATVRQELDDLSIDVKQESSDSNEVTFVVSLKLNYSGNIFYFPFLFRYLNLIVPTMRSKHLKV